MSNNQTPVIFTGKAGEYFGIWIVNLLLSIATFGIYSAWAKVRRKKYFYNNTLLDGVGLDYHAKPIAILKGRIIAVVLFVLYQVLAKFSPIVAVALLIIFFIALPWIVVRGLTFNARNSSYRGLRFDFDGKYSQAALAFVGYPLLILLTLGLTLPFVAQRVNKFVFNHHKFGLSHFQMNAFVKDFYKIYLKLLGVLLAIGLILSLAIYGWVSAHKPTHANFNQQQQSQQSTTNHFTKVADTTKPTCSDSADTHKPNPIERLFGSYATTLGAIVYALIFGIIFLYAIGIFAISAYVHSRVSNLIWNNTSLEHIGFSSNQRMRDLVWIYLSNAIFLICTLGLATPWVQVRMARYRIEHLAITGETDWDKFVGEKKEASRAMGEEIADMFDIDLSFG